MEPVTFHLSGHPQGKGRARAFRRGSFIGHYTPEKTRSYESMIRGAAMEAMAGRPPMAEPVEMFLDALFAVPASWAKKKQAAALTGALLPAKKPDLDNIAKAVKDALNGVVFADDAQIVRASLRKAYGPAPMIVVTVKAA